MMMVTTTVLLVLVYAFTCQAQTEVCGDTKTAYGFYSRYSSPGQYSGYDENIKCTIHFRAKHERDTVRLEVINIDLPEGCSDKVVVYDGKTKYDRELITLCGSERRVIESSGQDLLMVFTANDNRGRRYKGFEFRYDAVSHYEPTDSGLSAGEIIAFAIIPTVVFIATAVYIYKRCKYYSKVRRNLAAMGHTPEDMRMAMAMMLIQANRGNLVTGVQPGGGAQAGKRHTPNEVRQAIANLVSHGPVQAGQDPLQDCLLHHLNHCAAQRNNGATANGRGKNRTTHGRVRHPAGDVHAHRIPPEQFPLNPTDQSTVPFPSVDEFNHHYHPPHHMQNNDINGGNSSNNNVLINNNTAANLNYQGGVNGNNGYPSPYSSQYPVVTDPSGVYYAGNIDEHGTLHVPQDNNGVFGLHGPSASANSPSHSPAHSATHLNHLPVLDDDRHSTGSGRSSSRDTRHANAIRSGSVGRRSPHHQRHHQQEGNSSDTNVLTYYGVIGGQNRPEDSAPSAPSVSQQPVSDIDLLEAPPSYEEVTGGGRLSPYRS